MRKIILASASPRRKQFLEQMGIKFTIVPSNFEEYLDHNRSTAEVAKELALGKARAVAAKHPKALVIGSDAIITLEGRQLGKPVDEAEARAMLRDQCGHEVTATAAVALVCLEAGLEKVEVDETRVVMRPRDDAAIERYLKSGDGYDKAGGWGIQSGAAPLVKSMHGRIDTIMGLPTNLVAEMLQTQGISAKPVEVKIEL